MNLFNPDVQIRYQDVYSIRPQKLDIWGDYQAYTFHVAMGPEGEESYITYIPRGVRITLKDGSDYIVSTRYPMELTQLVRSKMINKASENFVE